MGRKPIDETGNTYGELTVIKRAGNKKKKDGTLGAVLWICKCSCGQNFLCAGTDLRTGETISCGHVRMEARSWKNKRLKLLQGLAKEKLSAREIGIEMGLTTSSISSAMATYTITSQWTHKKTGRYCYGCGVKTTPENAYKGHDDTACKACTQKERMVRRSSRRNRLNSIKEYLGCSRCGFNLHGSALDLHHVNRSNKILAVSEIVQRGGSWKHILDEICKCTVLCSRCHRLVENNIVTVEIVSIKLEDLLPAMLTYQ